MGREEDLHHTRSCNCDRDKYIYGKTTYRENYAIPDDDFYENEDVRWNKSSNHRSSGECSHRRVPSVEKETLSSFRQRACQFIESDSPSETESSTMDDCCSHCACSGVMKKARDLINYSPESNFLRNLKRQSEIAREDGCSHKRDRADEDHGCACGCKCYLGGMHEEEQHRTDYSKYENEPLKEQRSLENLQKKDDRIKKKGSVISQKDKNKETKKVDKKDKTHVRQPKKQVKADKKVEKKDGSKKDQRKKDNEENVRPKIKIDERKKVKPVATRVPHDSRPRKKSPPAKRKPREITETGSCVESEASLKKPRPNSCERCWKYASPARSPVNKPLQRYDPNFRRARGERGGEGGLAERGSRGSRASRESRGSRRGEGDFNPETKIMELMSPLGSVPKEKSEKPPPPVRQINTNRSKSQGAPKTKTPQVPKPRPESQKSIRRPAPENNWDSIDSTQYYSPPEKITAKKKPTGPPRRIAAPDRTVKKKDPPLQKKTSKIFEKPSKPPTVQPSSPLEDSPSSNIKIIDIDIPSVKRTLCPCSQRTEKTVPSENYFPQKRVDRVYSATFSVPRKERTTCICKSADYKSRVEISDEAYPPSRRTGEAAHRSPRSSHDHERQSRKSNCHCSTNRHHEETHKHRRRGKEHSKKCCCKCHCGAQHCTKQKYVVNDRLFAEPISKRPEGFESDSSEVPCDCGECRRRKINAQRHGHKNSPNENTERNEQSCSCKTRRDDNNNNNNKNVDAPKKYSVFYMTENRKNPSGNAGGIEVLVEQFTSRSKKNSKDKKSSKDTEGKIKNVSQHRPDSMALRFQKGITEKNKPPTSPRVLYF